jgi:polyisoprenyl-phosphate glycosyltransferase
MTYATRNASLITVVLPLLNEVAILPSLIQDLRSMLDDSGQSWSILFVNDGSTDGSSELLDELASSDDRIHVLHMSRNFGHAAAIRAGLDHAQGDVVILMDSDGQDDPKAIPEFLNHWSKGFQVVYAVRFARKESWWKRALFSSFYHLLARVSNIPIPRDAGSFCLLDRRVVDQLRLLPESDRYLPGLRSWVGFRQKSVPVERLARHDLNPRVRLRGLVSLAKTALFGFSRVPLHAFYWLAILSAVVCMASIGYATYHRLFTGLAIPGWASITSVSAFFGAINALGIAILGEYVARIYDQVRGRPSYIVARSKNIATTSGSTNAVGGHLSKFDEIALLEDLRAIKSSVSSDSASPRRPSTVPL